MNVIKYGDTRKIEEYNHRSEFRVFTCPVCGCVWEASIAPGTKEARRGLHLSEKNGYDGWYSDGWYSNCPMTNCPGVGTEVKEERT